MPRRRTQVIDAIECQFHCPRIPAMHRELRPCLWSKHLHCELFSHLLTFSANCQFAPLSLPQLLHRSQASPLENLPTFNSSDSRLKTLRLQTQDSRLKTPDSRLPKPSCNGIDR